ncbi:hypothetical protein IC617_00450 [Neiella sp. HB171785]|uniref:START domain-containing protein n=1 Tax=Neiella litorisoli TaxID=2771431 RepID=A0A8J6UEN5_9GAMM|nr:START domain-containing protein [Neiella litorisoli]MBD1387886.1 hypothetical protein [Neiella litorisoli]
MSWKPLVALVLALLNGVQTAPAADDTGPVAESWRIHWQRHDAVFASRPLISSGQREYFAQLQLAVPAEAMLALLLDTAAVPSWAHHATDAIVLQQLSGNQFLVYSRYSPPWPVSNRDLVTKSRHWHQDNGIWLQAEATPQLRGQSKGYLRVRQMQTCWFAQRMGPQQSRLSYLGYIDDPGSVPNFIVNPAQAAVLNTTLDNLINIIQRYEPAPAPTWDFSAPLEPGYCQRLRQVIDHFPAFGKD